MKTPSPTPELEESAEIRYAKKPKAAVFYPALGVILLFVVLALAMPEQFAAFVETGNTAVVNGLGWYYVLLTTGFVVFSVWIAFGRRGDVVLGKDDETPAYSMRNWFAMLFAAGMGIGLVFWGVAEPLSHMASPPPDVAGGTEEAIAQAAMNRRIAGDERALVGK